MRVFQFWALILIAVFVAGCTESPTDTADYPTPSFHKAPAPAPAPTGTILLGTTGTGTPSTLIEIDPATGLTLRTAGPVGFIVNGLEFDPATNTLFGSTAVFDPVHNGLIGIDQTTGAGTPVPGEPQLGLGTRDRPLRAYRPPHDRRLRSDVRLVGVDRQSRAHRQDDRYRDSSRGSQSFHAFGWPGLR